MKFIVLVGLCHQNPIIRLFSCVTTRHKGAWGRGDVAPIHSRPRH